MFSLDSNLASMRKAPKKCYIHKGHTMFETRSEHIHNLSQEYVFTYSKKHVFFHDGFLDLHADQSLRVINIYFLKKKANICKSCSVRVLSTLSHKKAYILREENDRNFEDCASCRFLKGLNRKIKFTVLCQNIKLLNTFLILARGNTFLRAKNGLEKYLSIFWSFLDKFLSNPFLARKKVLARAKIKILFSNLIFGHKTVNFVFRFKPFKKLAMRAQGCECAPKLNYIIKNKNYSPVQNYRLT